MKKEKKKRRISTTAALIWRIAVFVFALWLGAMSYLTVIVAQDTLDQYQRAASMHAHQTRFADEGEDAAWEKYHMADMMGDFWYTSLTNLDLPFYKNPVDDLMLIQRIQLDHDFETAVVYFDDAGNVTMRQRDYATLTYMIEESWFAGEEDAVDGYACIDLSKSALNDVSWMGLYPIRRIPFLDCLRLTGYFENGEFIPVSAASLRRTSSSVRNPDALSLGQLDKEGRLKWEILFESPTTTDRELIRIYTDDIAAFQDLPEPVNAGGTHFDTLQDLVIADMAQYMAGSDTGYSRDNLFDAVIIHHRKYTTVSGDSAWYSVAIHCRPMKTALLRLYPIYAVSLLIVTAIVLLFYRRIRRELTNPLLHIQQYGSANYSPLPETIESWWREPYELEQGYIQAQQTVHTLRGENNQLQAALDYAQNAETHRRQMISNITHELKTPLAIIHSYAEGLCEGIAADHQEQYLKTILEETERMDAMVLEMLDLSRLEAGKVRLATDQFSVLGLTRSIFQKLQPMAAEKDLQITYALAEEFDITADEGRIGQVITNFATNAIKYTPEGGNIWIKVYRFKGRSIFIMENQCEPLSEEALANVWNSFYRAEASRTTKGTGLGLSIAKAIIELHGGTVQVSNTGNGLEFRFDLP